MEVIKKIKLWLYRYLYKTIYYVFWTYFLFIIVLDFFDVKLNGILILFFFILLGLYLLHTTILQILSYKKRKNQNEKD